MKFDLAWGNSVAVRQAFTYHYNRRPVIFRQWDLDEFNYPKHEGDPELIETTRGVIKRQVGQEYKHVFLVNGATGGCVITMRAYQQRGIESCVTRKAPYYVRYPAMIKAAGLMHIDEDFWQHDCVSLIDIPSNPLGLMNNIAQSGVPVILDGVYLNRVYNNPIWVKSIPHQVLVGSYSKLTGLNGIRLGWIATDDDFLAARISELITSEYCGLSMSSQNMLKAILEDMEWDAFEQYARYKLDLNREQWLKVQKFFGDTGVLDCGMFYYAPMDQKCQELLTRAGVTWTKGSAMGTDDSFGRINLGQDNRLIEEAVKAILKEDKV